MGNLAIQRSALVAVAHVLIVPVPAVVLRPEADGAAWKSPRWDKIFNSTNTSEVSIGALHGELLSVLSEDSECLLRHHSSPWHERQDFSKEERERALLADHANEDDYDYLRNEETFDIVPDDVQYEVDNARVDAHAYMGYEKAQQGVKFPYSYHEVGPIVSHCSRARPLVVTPPDYNEENVLPLIIMLHAMGSDPFAHMEMFDYPLAAELEMKETKRDFRALYLLPWGKQFSGEGTRRFFNAGSGSCCDNSYAHPGEPRRMCGQDDTDYIRGAMDAAARHFKIDEERVYVTGWAGGAFMAHRLACDLSDVITAAAAFSGPLAGTCNVARPVPMLTVWGDLDNKIRIEGYSYADGFDVPWPGAKGTQQTWSMVNGCDDRVLPNISFLDLIVKDGMPNETFAWRRQCGPEKISDLWQIPAVGHFVPSWRKNDVGERYALGRHTLRWLFSHKRLPLSPWTQAARGTSRADNGSRYGEDWTYDRCLQNSNADVSSVQEASSEEWIKKEPEPSCASRFSWVWRLASIVTLSVLAHTPSQ